MSEGPPAGLLRRLAAIVYDMLIILALSIAASGVLLTFSAGEAIAAGTLWYQLILAAIVAGYFVISWWRRGQTIGMLAWRLRLLSADGSKVSLPQCLLRALAAAVSWLPAGLGFLWVLVDRRNRAWHDLATQTRLVFEKKLSAPAPTRQP